MSGSDSLDLVVGGIAQTVVRQARERHHSRDEADR